MHRDPSNGKRDRLSTLSMLSLTYTSDALRMFVPSVYLVYNVFYQLYASTCLLKHCFSLQCRCALNWYHIDPPWSIINFFLSYTWFGWNRDNLWFLTPAITTTKYRSNADMTTNTPWKLVPEVQYFCSNRK